ncbi:MAG: hypothetical protein R3C09_07790 [Pirellulaceae bacterium]
MNDKNDPSNDRHERGACTSMIALNAQPFWIGCGFLGQVQW